MKKIFFYSFLIIFVSLLFTCKFFAPDEEGGVEYTDVVYSPDGNSLTVYLEGTVPVSKSRARALTFELAKLGHDYFEVAFMHLPTGTIARAAWETGHPAGVKGVYRGADYSSPDPSSSPASAIIFVGKKSDKTLVAVGKLSLVDNTPGGLITADTRSVTFQIAALEAGTSFDSDESSFLTNTRAYGNLGNVSPANTEIIPVLVRNVFPLYRLPQYNPSGLYGRYEFDVKGGGIGEYLEGIRVAGAGTLNRVMPRYANGENTHETLANYYGMEFYAELADIGFSMINNQSANEAFQNPVDFEFTTGTLTDPLIPGKACALVFQIPVYPLSNSPAVGGAAPGTWYIRTSYDSYRLDLDEGTKMSTGGAVLLGIGDIGFLGLSLIITQAPFKTVYKNEPGNANSEWRDFTFFATGIIAYMQAGNRKLVRLEKENLRFYVDENIPITSGTTDMESYFTAYGTDGMLSIRVEYTYNTVIYADYFVIINSEAGGFAADPNMPASNLLIITGPQDLLHFQNTMTNTSGTYVLVFYESVDLGQYIFNTGGVVIIMLAGANNVSIGRGANTVFNTASTGPATNQFYFGMWPFNGMVVVDGQAINTFKLTVNAAGSYLNLNTSNDPPTIINPGAQYANNFIGGGGSFGVFVGGGAQIITPARLPYP